MVTTEDPKSTEPAWAAWFRAASIELSSIAIDAPEVGLVSTNKSGIHQQYRWDTRTGELTQLTFRPTGQVFGKLSPDGRWVAWLEDEAGNEIGHWVAIPSDGGEPVDLTPQIAAYASEEVAFARYGGIFSCITASDDRFAVRVGRLGADGPVGDLRTVHHTGAGLTTLALSADGSLAAFGSAHRSTGLEYSLLVVETANGDERGELWDGTGTSIVAQAFAPGREDHRILATTNASGQERALVWDPDDGSRRDLPTNAPAGDLVGLDWSPNGREILLCRTDHAAQRLLVWDLDSGTLRELDHPDGAFLRYYRLQASYFSPDGSEIVSRWEDFAHPRRLIGLDAATGRMTRTILSSGEVPDGRAFRSVSFPSTEGAPLQAWVGVPDGDPPYPVILDTHGGPTAATFANFDARFQAFLGAGFAVLTLNYHGSTTFGREFEHSIWGRLGELETQDLASARTWLVEAGIARPDQVFLTGWSYGGYLTLLGLGRQPELWAGGIAGIAVADWEMNYEDSTDLLRSYQRMLFGGDPEEKRDAMRAGSPLTYVDQVRAPVLILQGRNDTRTPARPVEVYVERLRERGKPVEIDWFEAGHMGADDELAIRQQARSIEFANRVIRG